MNQGFFIHARLGSSGHSKTFSARCFKLDGLAACGRRAHHKCSVEGRPCRMDFSRAQALLIASSGKATSMSLRGDLMG